MIRDEYGQTAFTEKEAIDLLYINPECDLSLLKITDPAKFNSAVEKFFADLPLLSQYQTLNSSIEEFDRSCQINWYMPAEYKSMDITEWILSRCHTQEQLQRCGQELLLYQEKNLFDLLRYLKYFVDTMRANNVTWGVGRGSSVASYVLYLIGIHRIDSMYYDLDIQEFLK